MSVGDSQMPGSLSPPGGADASWGFVVAVTLGEFWPLS